MHARVQACINPKNGKMVIIIANKLSKPGSNLELGHLDFLFILMPLKKARNDIIFHQQFVVGQPGLFSLGRATSLGEGKF